jgi:hypothetical protein
MRKKITGVQFQLLVVSFVIVLSYIGLGVFDASNIYAILNNLVPTSTMQGQEIFIILPMMVVVYAVLTMYLTLTAVIMIARAVYVYNNMKGGN